MKVPETIHCPACNQVKPWRLATSRYTNGKICDDCATAEAFEGPFWPEAQRAWDRTQATIRREFP